MADEFTAFPVGWLFDRLRETESALVAERIVLDANDARAVATRIRVEAIADPVRRRVAVEQLDAWNENQDRLRDAFSKWSGAWRAALSQARAFLSGVGVQLPADIGLAGAPGLGMLPGLAMAPWVVPAVVAAAVLTALAYAVVIHGVNQKQTKAIEAYENTLEAMVAAHATPAQLAEVATSYNGAARAEMDASPDLFGGLARSLQTILMLAAAVVLLPGILDMVKGRR